MSQRRLRGTRSSRLKLLACPPWAANCRHRSRHTLYGPRGDTSQSAGYTVAVFSSATLDSRARRIVAWVAGLNLFGFLLELVIAAIIGSAALFADAADFLEDFLINLLVLTALGWTLASRRKASFGLAGLILIPAFAAFGTAIWKMISGEPPEPLTLSVTAIIAMVINLTCALLLMNLRRAESALVRGAWLAARNDVLANILILAAGVVTMFWFSVWPDIVVGLIVGTINLTAAKEVYEQARAEDPELELDEELDEDRD